MSARGKKKSPDSVMASIITAASVALALANLLREIRESLPRLSCKSDLEVTSLLTTLSEAWCYMIRAWSGVSCVSILRRNSRFDLQLVGKESRQTEQPRPWCTASLA